jgi:hypothetical protein
VRTEQADGVDEVIDAAGVALDVRLMPRGLAHMHIRVVIFVGAKVQSPARAALPPRHAAGWAARPLVHPDSAACACT